MKLPDENEASTSDLHKSSRNSYEFRSKLHHFKEGKAHQLEGKRHQLEGKTHHKEGNKKSPEPSPQLHRSLLKSSTELYSYYKFSSGGGDVRINKDRQDTKDHHCTLPGEPKDILTKYIEMGIWVSLRRTIRRAMMINSNHPYTKYFAPSLYRRKEEETRHLVSYYHIIHPLSMFTFYFEMIMFIVIFADGIANPMIMMLFHESREILRIIFFPTNAMQMLLIILTFCTGYYDISRNVVYMKKRLIAINYFRTYFVTDAISILPQILRSNFVANLGFNYDVKEHYIVRLISPIFIVANYARYVWCLRILKQLRLYFGLSIYTYQTIRLIMNSLTTIMFSVYILYTILGAEIWLKFFSKEYKQSAVYSATEAYMRYRALPMSLRNRIYLYLDFRYQGHFYKESVIRNATSSALRREILLTMTKKSIEKVQLFDKCPGLVLNKIKANLVSNIYLPGDIIIKAGTTGHCMFFILAGTVVVTGNDNKELCYLRDGSHFGEVALVVHIKRVANVTAVTACELFKLDRNHFWDVMKNYPQVYNNIRTMATERVANTSNSIVDISIRDSIFSTATNKSIDKHTQDEVIPY